MMPFVSRNNGEPSPPQGPANLACRPAQNPSSPRALLLACALAVGSASTAPHACAQADVADLRGSRPNIILIITDDQGYGDLGCHGNPVLSTPNLDRLHSESTTFHEFHTSATCAPSRAALMSGQYPFKVGITHTIFERERMSLEATTLPELLQRAGYTTGIFGKWHLGDEDAYQPGSRGFDEVFIHGGGGIGQRYNGSCADAPPNAWPDFETRARYTDPIIRHNGTFVRTEGFCTDVFFDAAEDWIDRQRTTEAPFFAYIATNAPHFPYIAEEHDKQPYLDAGFKDPTASFFGMISDIDENVRELLSSLDAWGIEEDTLLIYTTDNGTALGRTVYNAGMRGGKGTPYKGGTRVPMIWRWPGVLDADRSIDTLTAHIDVLPTLCEIAGAELPANTDFDGRTLLPLLVGNDEGWPDRNLFFHVGRWPLGAEPDDYQYRNYKVRTQQWALINGELFDMSADTAQANNVADDHPETTRSMLEAYDDWWASCRPFMINEDAQYTRFHPPYHEAYVRQLRDGGIPMWHLNHTPR